MMNLNRFQCELQLKWVNLAFSVLFHSSMFPPYFPCQHQQCCGDNGNLDQPSNLAANYFSRKKLIELLRCLHVLCADARGAGTGLRGQELRKERVVHSSFSMALDSQTAP